MSGGFWLGNGRQANSYRGSVRIGNPAYALDPTS
jgi:hypothetical protein